MPRQVRRNPLCVYHGSCDDGFGAALAVHLALKGEVELYAGVYMKPPVPDALVEDRDVILVDFSYKRPVLENIIKRCRTLLVLDHHKTVQEDLGFLPVPARTWSEHISVNDSPARAAAVFDMERSGAMLAWNYFHPGIPAPRFYEYLQDRDLWRQQLPNGTEFTISLRSHPQTIEAWSRLMHEPLALIADGFPIARYYRQKIEEMKKDAVLRSIGGVSVPTCNAPYFAASELAGELCGQTHPFAACYFHNGSGWQFSLRSRGDFDVGAFARQFGGGGHKQSSGFTVDRLPWDDVPA